MLSARHRNDEIESFRDCRYFGASESCWRLLCFDLFYTRPHVERLPLHLHDEQPVFHRSGQEQQAANQNTTTKLLDWLFFCRAPVLQPPPVAHFRSLTYLQFPGHFHHVRSRGWLPRVQQQRYPAVGRLPPVHLTLESEERFYLRVLLCHITVGEVHNILTADGASLSMPTLNDLKTSHATFKAVCIAKGLAHDDSEWTYVLAEARSYATPSQMLQLLLFILVYNAPLNPDALIDASWDAVAERDDADNRIQAVAGRLGVFVDDVRRVQTQRNIREELEHISNGANIRARLRPFPDPNSLTDARILAVLEERSTEPREIRVELDYDRATQRAQYLTARSSIETQPSQIEALDGIIAAIEQQQPFYAFISSTPGCGKTYLCQAILNYCRAEGYIAIAVASTGIAALLLEGGSTLHSKLRAPLVVCSDSRLNVSCVNPKCVSYLWNVSQHDLPITLLADFSSVSSSTANTPRTTTPMGRSC